MLEKSLIRIIQILENLKASESVCSFEKTNDLFICNMMTYNTRKVLYEKVQLCATVRDCKLWTSQGTMCRKEIYNISLQDFADFLKISVVATYNLIGCVTSCVQPQQMVVYWVNCLSSIIKFSRIRWRWLPR